MGSRFTLIFQEMPLIGIFRGITPVEVEAIVGGVIETGIRVVEVPLNSPDALLSLERLVKCFGDDVIVGADGVDDHRGAGAAQVAHGCG